MRLSQGHGQHDDGLMVSHDRRSRWPRISFDQILWAVCLVGSGIAILVFRRSPQVRAIRLGCPHMGGELTYSAGVVWPLACGFLFPQPHTLTKGIPWPFGRAGRAVGEDSRLSRKQSGRFPCPVMVKGGFGEGGHTPRTPKV